MNNMKFSDHVSCGIEKKPLKLEGKFHLEQWRNGELIKKIDITNGITNEGKNKVLDVMFHAVSAITTWYIGLIDGTGTQTLAAGDTMASHAGWSENTSYDEAVRQTWAEGAAASQSITNATPATFTMNATDTLHGVFITSDSVKSGITGTLWSTAAFTTEISVVAADALKITYTVNAA